MSSLKFSDLPLCESVQRGIAETGYTTPTPIQAGAIPHLIAGRDLLGCAQTGTGKTAAFALPVLHQLDTQRRPAMPNCPTVLVLSPTRELASQIGENFQTYGRFVRVRQTVVFGGVGQGPQVRALSRGVHILIATPGRLLDLMGQGHIRLDRLETFILDEADRMLDMGFLPDIRRITSTLPANRQSLFFSATMPPQIAQLADSLLQNPERVEVATVSSTVDKIEQRVMHCDSGEKIHLLNELLQDNDAGRVLVFTRTKRRADNVAKSLQRTGVVSEAIHGNKSQNARTRALNKFRAGHTRVLVATDVAARGLDVDDISHVVNFDLPNEPESYVHRIGRTGRAGASGIALSFCDPSERRCLRSIERLIRQAIGGGGGETQRNQPSRHPRNNNGAPPQQQGGPNGEQSRPDGSPRRRRRRKATTSN